MAVTKHADSNVITTCAILINVLLHQLQAPPSALMLPHSVGTFISASHDKQESTAGNDECGHAMR
jgi:hypothetical protein